MISCNILIVKTSSAAKHSSNKRLSSQKGIKVEFDSIPEANHFFSKTEAPLVKSLNQYIKKETALY